MLKATEGEGGEKEGGFAAGAGAETALRPAVARAAQSDLAAGESALLEAPP